LKYLNTHNNNNLNKGNTKMYYLSNYYIKKLPLYPNIDQTNQINT
jgi:hypothetical protein